MCAADLKYVLSIGSLPTVKIKKTLFATGHALPQGRTRFVQTQSSPVDQKIVYSLHPSIRVGGCQT